MVLMQIGLVTAVPSRLLTGTLCLCGERLDLEGTIFTWHILTQSEAPKGRLLAVAPCWSWGHLCSAVVMSVPLVLVRLVCHGSSISGAEWVKDRTPSSPQTPVPRFLLSTDLSLFFSSFGFHLVLRYWLFWCFLGSGHDPAFVPHLCTLGHLSPSCACHYPYFWRFCIDFWTD